MKITSNNRTTIHKITGAHVSKTSTPSIFWLLIAQNLVLYFFKDPSGYCFFLKAHVDFSMFAPRGLDTILKDPKSRRDFNGREIKLKLWHNINN